MLLTGGRNIDTICMKVVYTCSCSCQPFLPLRIDYLFSHNSPQKKPAIDTTKQLPNNMMLFMLTQFESNLGRNDIVSVTFSMMLLPVFPTDHEYKSKKY
jgi:hypothetical protein